MTGKNLIRWQTKIVNGNERSNSRRIDGKAPNQLERFILPPLASWLQGHACIGARHLIANKEFYACIPGEMDCLNSSLIFLNCLDQYFDHTDDGDPIVKSLIVIFYETIESKQEFFDKFWSFAQTTHDLDSLSHEWDASIPSDVTDKEFELSFRGRGVFPTTFHPCHDRPSRRFMYPGWAHNQSSQFDELRARGEFETWQKKIRRTDSAVDPSDVPNPLLADKEDASSAAQLGQLESEEYPFRVREPADRDQVIPHLRARAHAEGASDVLEYLDGLP